MPDELIARLKQFREDYFTQNAAQFRELVERGQAPNTLFITCCDARLVPHLMTGTGPGELFLVRNVGAIVPPYQGAGAHSTGAAIEFGVVYLGVRQVIICGHSHCGAMRALYEAAPADAIHLRGWLEHAREAMIRGEMSEELLRRTEQRSVILQIERLLGYPMVRKRVEAGELKIQGWHYVIEDGDVHVFDPHAKRFVSVSELHQDEAPD